VQQRVIPRDWPDGEFDLIVLSELLYYFGGGDLGQVLGRAAAALRPGGTLLAVHWRHPVAEYPRSGDEVHRALAAQAGLARLAEHREPDFLAEVYLRADGEPVSVAQAGGLV
jgi:SAM-dependent methyltransferase